MSDVDAAALEAARERPDDVAVVLTELSSLVVDSERLDQTLQRIVDLAARTMPGCDAAGVTLVDSGGGFVTAAYTDDRTVAVDRRQYDQDDGPCLDAIRRRTVNRVDVEDALATWPDFAEEAKGAGVRSFLAAPLVVGDAPLGALNLYSHELHGFDALDETFVTLLTGQASVAVANSRRYADVAALASQMQEAIRSRAVIEQAKGVLMAREAIDAESAFTRLRQHSQHRNVKLRVVAQELVDEATSPDGNRADPEPAGA